ncbi:DUF6301 family protein [Gryllotalpicola reticulitermitis]|uniref:DUF6301 family protein n=1 Tax=Gryllotalpicola reticulitermitis TaxID=1184153 RepID=A0ABV8Q985_9MICO
MTASVDYDEFAKWVFGLAADRWPARAEDFPTFAARHGVKALSDGANEYGQSTLVLPFDGVEGDWTQREGAPVLVSAWLAQIEPPDQDGLRVVYDGAASALETTFGDPIRDIDEYGAPKSVWDRGTVRVSLNAYWSGTRKGVVILWIEQITTPLA